MSTFHIPSKFQWAQARAFVEAIAGSRDPEMTYQVFDDKGKRYELAAWKHGRLSNPKMQRWLADKQANGCGVYVVVNECDGEGRQRKHVRRARASFIDLDGAAPPDAWPTEPDIINETSPGKYHCFWLLNAHKDLNLWSDTQCRLAAYYGSDPVVHDPPRVVRLPGFYHLKATPFRSRTLKIGSFEDAQFDRHELPDIVTAHPADYTPPAARADGGRSEKPEAGWDNPSDIERARVYLARVKPPEIGDRNNQGYRVAAVLNDLGISPGLSETLLAEIWNPRISSPLEEWEIRHVIKSAARYKNSSAGSRSLAAEIRTDFDDFEVPNENDDAEVALGSGDEFDFEGTDGECDLISENGSLSDQQEAASGAYRRPEKTVKRVTDGLSWSYASEIRAVPISWLWENRIPQGKVTIIAGFPDQGKSQIMLKIAAIISTGGEWPNGEGRAPLGVAIILSSEDEDDDTLTPRLYAAGANLRNIIILRPMLRYIEDGKKRRRVLNIEDDIQKVDNIVKQVQLSGRRVRMIGLDPINAYFGGARKADSHKNSDMRALLTPLTEWAARLKVALIAISHFNKGNNSHTLYRITDSTAITAAARAVFVALKKEDLNNGGNAERIFIPIKKNLAPDALSGIRYEIETADVGELTGKPGQLAPFVRFGSLDDTSAEEAMGGLRNRGRKDNARDGASTWLLERLAGGPVKAGTLKGDALANGISWRTLCRAKDDLGCITVEKRGYQGAWHWRIRGPYDDFGDEPAIDPEEEVHEFG